MRWFEKTNINFVGARAAFFYISVILSIAGIISTFMLGIQYGIDFQGGTEIAVEFDKPVKTANIRDAVEKAGLTGSEIKSFGQDNQYLIRVKESEDAPQIIDEAFKARFPDVAYATLKVDKIGPKIGAELREQAFIAVFLAIIVILIYIAFRFEFTFGLGAIVAIIHDVIITFTIIVIVNHITPLNLEINQSILAAMLTVVGYSINGTVIIFDRIRENREVSKGLSFVKLVNLSVNQTMSRTINTVGTTLLVLVTMVLFGGPVLQGFAFTMSVGIIFGTYSSIYISTSFVIWYFEKVKKINVEGVEKKVATYTAKI